MSVGSPSSESVVYSGVKQATSTRDFTSGTHGQDIGSLFPRLSGRRQSDKNDHAGNAGWVS